MQAHINDDKAFTGPLQDPADQDLFTPDIAAIVYTTNIHVTHKQRKPLNSSCFTEGRIVLRRNDLYMTHTFHTTRPEVWLWALRALLPERTHIYLIPVVTPQKKKETIAVTTLYSS